MQLAGGFIGRKADPMNQSAVSAKDHNAAMPV
jgi:hypothetical protein